jgi:hypothetical protein
LVDLLLGRGLGAVKNGLNEFKQCGYALEQGISIGRSYCRALEIA